MFIDDNPDANLDDVLTHYGVKGMKWGPDTKKTTPPVISQHVATGHAMTKAILDSGHAKVVIGGKAMVWTPNGARATPHAAPTRQPRQPGQNWGTPTPVQPKPFRKVMA